MSTSSVLVREIKRAFDQTRKEFLKAEVAALNRAANTALSRTIKFIRQKYNIKAKDFKEQTRVEKATKNKTKVRIIVSDKGLKLILFSATQTKKGVKATEQKGKRRLYSGSFIATMKSGHKGVYIRKGKNRFPIKELYGPSAMQLFSSKQAQAELEKVFYERLKIEMEYAINRFVK